MAKTAAEALAELVALKVKLTADLWDGMTDDEKQILVDATMVKVWLGQAEKDVARKIIELARTDGLDTPEFDL